MEAGLKAAVRLLSDERITNGPGSEILRPETWGHTSPLEEAISISNAWSTHALAHFLQEIPNEEAKISIRDTANFLRVPAKPAIESLGDKTLQYMVLEFYLLMKQIKRK